MSAHYTFMLTSPPVPQAVASAEVLRCVLNGDASRSCSFPPAHKFFDAFNPECRPHNCYPHVQPGAWQSAFWMETRGTHSCYAGVNLCLPGRKFERIEHDCFPLSEWLATKANAKGPVGILLAESCQTASRWF